MDIKDLNRISIKQYLADKSIYPVKDRGYYGMYYSPFREDKDASLKVDYNKNLWIDFGSNEGGTMIDLVMRIKNCSLTQAIEELKRYDSTSVNQYDNTTVRQLSTQSTNQPLSFHGNNTQEKESGITIRKILPITDKALIDYLTKREINIDIAKQHCAEIHYSVNNKEYFAIGFKNDSGGYELRNKYFKGCTSKDIRTYIDTENNNKACFIFEGFVDYLSYLTIKNIQKLKQDTIVLNSVTNLPKAINKLSAYLKIYAFLDNDEAGKRAVQNLRSTGKEVLDQSVHYANCKDLNDYLISTRKAQKIQQEKQSVQVKRKPSGGFKR